MDPFSLIERLEAGAAALSGVTAGMSSSQAAWRPAPDQWSLLEIACHLLDEEREDFRVRLDYTLHRPGEAWPTIDPTGWVRSHDYAGREFAATMAAFAEERGRSLDWLRALRDPDWDAAYQHPRLGVIRAGDLLASWCAHDVLHLRQMARWHWRRLQDEAGPFGTGYAGQW
ncbi:MAG: DinB family protein [bacterium]|nr:DinB family protein [bacterium]